jgi:carboxyl-terminal processing protease
MNVLRTLIAPLVVTFALTPGMHGASDFDFQKIAPKVSENVSELLERAHYSKQKLDDRMSKQLLKNYLERWDYNHLFFTQKDVDEFNAKYATTLDDDLRVGNVQPATKIFEVYKKRVEDRVAKVKEQVKGTFDFSSERAVELNRLKAPWPKDEAEADQIWKDRIEGEMLDRRLSNDKVDSPEKVLNRRYDQLLRNIREQGAEDVIASFLSVLAETYDPHSEYLSRSQLDSFNINMSLQLVGIGAVLTSDEGYAKIRELVPGGPAAEDGRIKVGDRISAVAQDKEEFVETADLKLDKVVEMIRGKEDTVVRLKVIPGNATDPSERKIIEITRKKVKLKEQEAKAEIIERPMPDGSKQRLGWIILPSFYADMQHSGKDGAKSTTKDVLALLERLKKENIDGLVMDLRRNGGGSLEEAVNLTGLFIKRGPVVQVQDSNGRTTKLSDKDLGTLTYDGPMVVLTNKLSASASEIFAAALQDYNRAVVVGDSSTFGKGTVQTMVELANIVPLSLTGNATGNEAGALKLTIQKFFRVSGGSTQLEGVRSDIKLPSLWDQTDIGESALKGPLPYTTIKEASYDKVDKDLFKDELKRRSSARVGADEEFRWVMEDIDRSKKRIAENKVTLNEKSRRSELDDEKARKEKRDDERAKHKAPEEKVFSVTLDNASKPELELKTEKDKLKDQKANAPQATPKTPEDPKLNLQKPDEKKPEDSKPAPAKNPSEAAKPADPDADEDEEVMPKTDPIRAETLNILRDLVDFTKHGVPATAATAPKAETAR